MFSLQQQFNLLLALFQIQNLCIPNRQLNILRKQLTKGCSVSSYVSNISIRLSCETYFFKLSLLSPLNNMYLHVRHFLPKHMLVSTK